MYAVVAAAKALYERLGAMGESSIDGDTFLDLWVYVILRAKVKDLVSGCVVMKTWMINNMCVYQNLYFIIIHIVATV